MRRFDDKTKIQVQTAAVAYVRECYRLWCEGAVSRSEPALSVGSIADALDQRADVGDDYKYASRKRRYALVRAVLDAAVRRGLLACSIGTTSRGTQARCYEPGSDQ